MNTRFFVIGGGVILLLFGFGAFLVYDMNAPVQEVKVYEVPDRLALRAPHVESSLDTTGTTVAIATGQQSRSSDNTTAQYLSDSDQGDEATVALGENGIEPCCPDEASLFPVGDIDFGQDQNLDKNPVSPEVRADSKQYFEYMKALKVFDEKYMALSEELLQLNNEFKYLISLELDESLLPKLEAWQAKKEALMKKREELNRQEPVYPISTHTH